MKPTRDIYDKFIADSHVYSKDYCMEYANELWKIINEASEEAVAICQAWDDENFGKPGYGGIAWVMGELDKANTAIKVINDLRK